MAANFTVKNIPQDIFDKVKERADWNRRSINGEIISILTAATAPKRVPVEEILVRARALRAKTHGRLTEDVLDRAKREGRP